MKTALNSLVFASAFTLHACSGSASALTFEQFRNEAGTNNVESLRVGCSEVVGVYRRKAETFRTPRTPAVDEMIASLRQQGVDVQIRKC